MEKEIKADNTTRYGLESRILPGTQTELKYPLNGCMPNVLHIYANDSEWVKLDVRLNREDEPALE